MLIRNYFYSGHIMRNEIMPIHEKYDIRKLNNDLKELNKTNEENKANYNIALIIIFILAFLLAIISGSKIEEATDLLYRG